MNRPHQQEAGAFDAVIGRSIAVNPTREKLRLIKLNSTQTDDLPYPSGSILWYKNHGSEMMASGTVKAIHMDVLSRSLYYEMNRSVFENVRTIVDVVPADLIAEEDIICFGAGAHVRVKLNSGCQELNGKILSGSTANGRVTYTVMLFVDSNKSYFRVEEQVAQDRVKYRSIASIKEDQIDKRHDACSQPTVGDEPSSSTPKSDHRSNISSGQKRSVEEGTTDESRDSSIKCKRAHSTSSGSGSSTMDRIIVPSWLLNDRESQKKLHAHLSKNTALKELIRGKGDEMYISAHSTTSKIAARDLVQESLLSYLGSDKSKGRLVFDLALSVGTDIRKLSDASNAVKTNYNYPSGHGMVWVTAIDLDLSFKNKQEEREQCRWLLKQVGDVRVSAGCSIKVYGEPCFAGPLKMCSPYILIFGKRLDDVKKAFNELTLLIKDMSAASGNE